MNILEKFKLSDEKEDFHRVCEDIEHGIHFRGTNLWILVFAVLIASLGLNVNSTAVIIGAMLVSPLMGPIMGLGFGMAINNLKLLRSSFFAYMFAAAVGLISSAIFFFISPLNDAHSELLARTDPNIYDVFIAFLGGLAGMLATSSKIKGNVIPGVAIATALMPPLCTAGYGLASLKAKFFFGAFYLFLINTVFIALATMVTARFLKYPYKKLPGREDDVFARRVVYAIVIITFLPSIYLGYNLVQEERYVKMATDFIDREVVFPNDYLLKKSVDPKGKVITIILGGDVVSQDDIDKLQGKLADYNLNSTKLIVKQGFAYLQQDDKQDSKLATALDREEKKIQQLQRQLDSISTSNSLSQQVFKELQVQYPGVKALILHRAYISSAEGQGFRWICSIETSVKLSEEDQARIEDWIKVRIQSDELLIYFR